jgi:hypothetical protein
MVQNRKSKTTISTPTMTAGNYKAGHRFGSSFKLEDVMDSYEDAVVLKTLVILDKEGQDAAFDILFFTTWPTIASEDSLPLDISDDELTKKCIGRVVVSKSDYTHLQGNSLAVRNSVDAMLKAEKSNDLYCVLQCKSDAIFSGTTPLTIKMLFEQY